MENFLSSPVLLSFFDLSKCILQKVHMVNTMIVSFMTTCTVIFTQNNTSNILKINCYEHYRYFWLLYNVQVKRNFFL